MESHCDLKALKSFVVVAEEGGVSAAARRLGVTQSAISKHVAVLERHYGTALVQRDGRGTRLTSSGAILLEHGRRILAQTEAFAALTRTPAIASAPHRLIHLGLLPTVAEIVLPELVALLVKLDPTLRLRVSEASSGTMESWLLQGVVDGGVIYQSGGLKGLEVHSTHADQHAIVVSPSTVVDGRDLREVIGSLPFILPARPYGLRVAAEAQFARLGLALDVRHEIASYGAMRKLAADGVGATILPINVVDEAIQRGELRRLVVPGLSIRRSLVVVRRGDTAASDTLALVLGELGALLDRACVALERGYPVT